jgi:hypothetical protein
MPNGSAAMGRVLPREKSGVDADPWRRLTQSTGSRRDSTLALLGAFDPPPARATPSSIKTELTAASPDVFRKARLLGPIDLSLSMFAGETFREVILYQAIRACKNR